MILIADSGSSKTDWRLIDDSNQIHQCTTQGFNPYFQSSDDFLSIIKNELLKSFSSVNLNTPLQIFYYGAGCGTDAKKEIVKLALKNEFSDSTISIHSDLLAAARATCGNKNGLVTILGTGANSCYYDGMNIVENSPSLGYVLGDEGSGAHIGKTFIAAYLNKELPEELSNRFYQRFQLNKDEVLDTVYRKPNPNRYLATFSKFVYQNLKEPTMVNLVANCFEELFEKHILKLAHHRALPLNCVGSVAYYYSNILRAVALKKGISMGTIIESPIAGLSLYHQEKKI